ncbi:MAG: bifunctional RNase H/acid phosphatase [Acidimicrobiales bacterium]|nr:bifunctional RNase H/acid phosphatase [Acidimicrobiales bacterium]
MPRLHLVRHGRAAAGWGDHGDPGLDDVGRAQAAAAAEVLAALGPLPLVCSPLRRTRETAAPIAARLGVEPRIEPAVGELPSPTDDLAERAAWLPGALAGTWADLDHRVAAWRSRLVDELLGLPGDAVIVTHFVAINAVVGWAIGEERICTFAPTNASITVLDTDGRSLTVVRLGAEADTTVG